MKVGEVYRHGAISIANTEGITEAARLMRERHVSFLIVHQLGDDLRRPIGVLTDRDLVVEVMAKQIDPRAVKVDDLMTRDPVVANESEDLADVLSAMRLAGIRRVPVVDMRVALVVSLPSMMHLISSCGCNDRSSGRLSAYGSEELRRSMRTISLIGAHGTRTMPVWGEDLSRLQLGTTATRRRQRRSPGKAALGAPRLVRL